MPALETKSVEAKESKIIPAIFSLVVRKEDQKDNRRELDTEGLHIKREYKYDKSGRNETVLVHKAPQTAEDIFALAEAIRLRKTYYGEYVWVKADDLPRFVDSLYKDAARLGYAAAAQSGIFLCERDKPGQTRIWLRKKAETPEEFYQLAYALRMNEANVTADYWMIESRDKNAFILGLLAVSARAGYVPAKMWLEKNAAEQKQSLAPERGNLRNRAFSPSPASEKAAACPAQPAVKMSQSNSF